MIILGAGGFANELACWYEQTMGREVLCFYAPTSKETSVFGKRVIHQSSDLPSPYESNLFLAAIGDPLVRDRLSAEMHKLGYNIAPGFAHKSVILARNVIVGLGTILCPNVVVGPNVYIGKGVIVNLASTIGHDSILSDYVTVNPGCNISGNVKVGSHSILGTNSAIREKTTLGVRTIIGMGATVVKDSPGNEILLGNPAKSRNLK